MLKPTLGELVGNISRSLREDVLGEVPQGAAQRQLKAALHALDRVERSWGQLGQMLIEDNRDITATLRDIVAALETEGTRAPEPVLSALNDIPDEGSGNSQSDDFFASLMNVNEHLQALLLVVDPWLRDLARQRPETGQYLDDLSHLYRRMVARELTATAGDEFTAEELARVMRDAQTRMRRD